MSDAKFSDTAGCAVHTSCSIPAAVAAADEASDVSLHHIARTAPNNLAASTHAYLLSRGVTFGSFFPTV